MRARDAGVLARACGRPGAAAVNIQILLLAHGKTREHVVADEIRRREVLARGVHRLKDELRVVLPLGKRDGDDLKAANTVPNHVGVIDLLETGAEEVQVLNDAMRLGDYVNVRVLQMINNGAQRSLIALRER